MPDLQYGMNVTDRDRGNLPEIPVINMFVEESVTEPKPVLQSRPGLENSPIAMGAVPVKSLFKVDGILSNGLFGVSGTTLYNGAASLGSINGTGFVTWGGYADRVFVNAGEDVWQWNGSALTSIATPDSVDISSICIGASRLIVVSKDTGRFYWSDPLTGTVDALSFATAEQSPDKVRQCLYLADTLMLFGAETVEFWPNSAADPDLPFVPLVGRTFSVGIREVGCATTWNNTFAWITDRNQICVGDPNTTVSSASLEEKLSASVTARLWTFLLEGVEYLAVRLDDSTWVMNPRSSQWSKFESDGEANWIPQCFDDGYFGSSINGQLVWWSNDHADFGGTLERRFRAGAPLDVGTLPLNNVVIRTNSGRTPFTVGVDATPMVELRTSKDNGENWSDWWEAPLGQDGEYRKRVIFRSLGSFSHPSLLVEVRMLHPVPFRVSNMVFNEPYGSV